MPKGPISKATQRSLKELEQTLGAFSPHWETWARSGYSVVSRKEYLVVESYRHFKTHRVYANKNGVTTRHAASVYNNATRKLRQPQARQRFRKWLVYESLTKHGIAPEEYDLDSLVKPVSQWLVPSELVAALLRNFLEDKPVPIPSEQVKLIRDLNGYNHFDMQSVRKNHLCIHVYLNDSGLW